MLSSIVGVVVFFGLGSLVYGAPSDGLYVGTNDQGRPFEVRVTGGRVDQWMIDFSVSCEYGGFDGNVRTTISPSCAIEADGSFVCGSLSCPSGTVGVNSEISGQFFSDDTVTGNVRLAARIGGGCCNLDTTFSASLEGGGGGGGGFSGAFNYFVAAIAHTRGVGDSVWRTKLGVLNFSGATAEVELTYLHDGEASTETLTLAHGELRTWDDAAVGLFGVSGRSSGPVFIASDRQLVITSRTYSEGEQGTFGSFMEAAGLSQTFVFGDVGVVSQLCGNNDFRTNIGLVNLTDSSCEVRVRVRSASGVEIGSPVNVTLDAYGFEQINDVFAASGSGFRDNAYAVVNVLTQGCEVWGYGSVIDGVAAFPGTNDATIIPMRKVWVGPGPNLIVFQSADFSTTDGIIGMFWIPESQVTLTIDRGADGSIDLERTTIVEQDGAARFNYTHPDPTLQVAEGDIVELSDGVTRITYVVCYVTLDSIDLGTNIVSGKAREGTEVLVGVNDPAPHDPHSREFRVIAGSSETWTVDFTGVFDIVSDTTGYVISGCGQSQASTSIEW
jgi:hypothetical protein